MSRCTKQSRTEDIKPSARDQATGPETRFPERLDFVGAPNRRMSGLPSEEVRAAFLNPPLFKLLQFVLLAQANIFHQMSA